MRLLLLAFLAVAAASRSYVDQETGFRGGKDYTYAYTSQVLSGISVDNIQFAGIKFKANVKFTPLNDKPEKVQGQFQPARIMRLNKELPHYHPTDSIPDSEWTPVNAQEQQLLNAELQKKFQFEIVPGKYINFKPDPTEPHWSANVKRGLLSFMQLNLRGPGPEDRDQEELRLMDKLNLVTPQAEVDLAKTYKVNEEDITGICQSVYNVRPEHQSSRSGANVLQVTKVRNYDLCQRRPKWQYGLMENIVFDPQEYKEQKVLRWQVDSDYEVQKDNDGMNYIIKHGRLVSRQHFNRIDIKKGKLITYAVQQITFVDVEESRQSQRDMSSVRPQSLEMKMPEPSFTERQQPQSSTSEERAKAELMDELLSEAAAMTHPNVLPNATKPIAKVNVLLRKLQKQTVQSLVQKYCRPGRQGQLSTEGQIFLDSLTTCTRSDTVPIIAELVKHEVISDLRGSHMMAMVGQLALSTPNLASDLIQVVKDSSKLPSNAIQTRRSALLALGTVGFKIQRKADRIREPSLRQVADRIAQELIQMLQSSQSTHDKIIVLKAIGNSGLQQCFGTLKNKIITQNEELTVRVKAMYALRRMSWRKRSQVQSLAMDIYMKRQEPEDLRIAGFVIIMQTVPQKGLLRIVGKNLQTENSLQVGSFVYSYLKSRTDFQNPVYRNESNAIKDCLTYAKPFRPGFAFSKNYKWELYSDSVKCSWMPEMAHVMSRNSILPETLLLRNDMDWVGFPFLGYELGIETEGLQTIMKNVVGPKSALKDLLQGRLTLKDILEPIQRPSPEMIADIRTMMDKITISERQLQNFALTMYLKSLDFETHYFSLDSRSIQSAFQFALGNSLDILRELEQGIQMKTVRSNPIIDMSYCVPTPTGLPLYLNMTWNTVFVLDASARVENVPSVRDLMSAIMPSGSRSSSRYQQQSDRQDRNWRRSSSSELKADFHLRPTISMDSEVTVGVEMANLRTCITQHAKLFAQYPLSAEVKADPETGMLKSKLRLPQRSEEILQLVENSKTCFIRNPEDPTRSRFYVEEKVVSFPTCSRIESDKDRYRIPYADMDLEVYSQRAVFTRPTPLHRFLFGLKNYTLYLQPTSQQAKEISVKSLYLGPQRVERSTDLIHEVLHLDTDESSDSEDRDRDQRRRRSESEDEDDDSWWWSWGGSQRSSSYGRDRSSSSRNPFQPVHAKSSVSSSNKYKMITCLKTHGSRSEKKIQIQVTHMCSDDKKKHQNDIQVVYDSPDESSRQEKKIALSTFTDTEVLKKHLIERPSSYQSKELVCKAELFYGPKDYTQKYIDAEVKMGRGAPLSLPRVHTTRTYTEPTRAAPLEVSLDLDYQSIPRKVVHYCKKADTLLKLLPYVTDQVSVESQEASNPQNKLKVVAQFRADESEIELLVKSPTEDEVIKGIPIPFLPRRDASCSLAYGGFDCYNKWTSEDKDLYRSSGPRPLDSFIHYISGGRVPGKCQVLGQQIHTFDKETVHFPKTDCEIILAKDCSSSRSPSFMITVKEKNKDENKKVIHIYDPEHKIEVKPLDGWFDSGMQVKVDDKKIPIPDEGQKITVHKDDSDPRSEKVCDIKKKADGKVEIYSYKSQITVKTDGVDIDVKAHPSYFGQLCGACSNYNSEPMDDLMGPRKEMYTRPEEFLLSYIIPNSRCNIDEVRAKLVSRIPRLFAARDSSSCQKIQQHRYETRQRDGESQACFSVRPVPTCAGDCSQQQGKERSTPVGFFCLRASDRKVPELLNKMKEGQELTEVKGKKPHFTKEVKIADQCRPRSGNDVRDRDQNKQDRDQNKQDRDQNKQDRDQYKQDRDQQQERQYIQEA